MRIFRQGKVEESDSSSLDSLEIIKTGYAIAYPLVISAGDGNFEMVKYLVDSGVDISAGFNWPMRVASESGHLEIVKYLVSKGCDIEAGPFSPMIEASSTGRFDIIKYLVSVGADISRKNNSAIKAASKRSENVEIVKYFIGVILSEMKKYLLLSLLNKLRTVHKDLLRMSLNP